MKTPFLRLSALLIASSLLLVLSVLALSGQVDDLLPSILTENEASVKGCGNDFMVILDAGHGGEDGGAVGIDGTLEKDLNLQVVFKIRDLLEECGLGVILTRSDDSMLGNGSSGHKKLADLRARLDIANACPDALLLSVHMNKFPMEYCRGVQLYYSPGSDGSLPLAQALHEAVKEWQPDNEREIKKAGSAIYLLDRARIPAVLIECGFLSNGEECALLKSEAYQKQLAALIVSALAEYHQTQIQT